MKKGRKDIFIRDKYLCYICGCSVWSHRKANGDLDTLATIDHVIPRSKGGTNDPNNLKTCCYACNTRKGDQLLVTSFKHRNNKYNEKQNHNYDQINARIFTSVH